jgi:hypothetical protein
MQAERTSSLLLMWMQLSVPMQALILVVPTLRLVADSLP